MPAFYGCRSSQGRRKLRRVVKEQGADQASPSPGGYAWCSLLADLLFSCRSWHCQGGWQKRRGLAGRESEAGFVGITARLKEATWVIVTQTGMALAPVVDKLRTLAALDLETLEPFRASEAGRP